MKIFLFDTIFVEIKKGEKLPEHTARTIQATDKPSWGDWCKQFNICSKIDPNKPFFFEV